MIAESWWVVWLAAAAGSFAVLETLALANRREGDTLSEYIRAWLGVYPARPFRRIATAVFASGILAFIAWFIPHIVL